MAPLPQLADISHKRKNSVDEVSPRFDGYSLAAMRYASSFGYWRILTSPHLLTAYVTCSTGNADHP
jgi:hypothetical protein